MAFTKHVVCLLPIGKNAIQVLPALQSFSSALFVMLKINEWLKVR